MFPARCFLFFGLWLTLLGCMQDKDDDTPIKSLEKNTPGFTLREIKHGFLLDVYNPWQGAQNVNYRYLLLKKEAKVPAKYQDLQVIQIPVEKVVVMSTTHIGMIDKLGKISSIKGISGRNLMSNPAIIRGLENETISDVGYDQGVDVEKLLDLNPDVIFTYGVSNEGGAWVRKLKDAGINVVFNADYLENTPLGMASWLRFFAAFYNDFALADSILIQTEAAYNSLAGIVDTITNRPKILTGLPWKGTWYMPAGGSYMVNFINDAGGFYPLSEQPGQENIPMDIEAVYGIFHDADIWINTGSASGTAEIAGEDARLGKINAFNEGDVFNNTGKISAYGGNEYWESGPVNPDIILKDLIHIFHPEIFPAHQLVYYKHLN